MKQLKEKISNLFKTVPGTLDRELSDALDVFAEAREDLAVVLDSCSEKLGEAEDEKRRAEEAYSRAISSAGDKEAQANRVFEKANKSISAIDRILDDI